MVGRTKWTTGKEAKVLQAGQPGKLENDCKQERLDLTYAEQQPQLKELTSLWAPGALVL